MNRLITLCVTRRAFSTGGSPGSVSRVARGWGGRCALVLVLAFGAALSADPPGDDAGGVVFRVAGKPIGTVPGGVADRIRGPDRRLWIVYRAEWATGADVLDVQVTTKVELRLTVAASAARRVSEDPPPFLAAYIDGRLFAVGSVSLGEAAGEIVLKHIRPQRAVVLANALGAPGAMAAGPRLSVSPQTSSMLPGGRMPVDVYASGIADLAAYDVVLEVRNGLRGVFLIEDARVDQTRADFVFAGVPGVTSGAVLASARIKGSAATATVDPTRAGYLGTLVFRATTKAEGTFTIRIHEGLSELRDANGRSIPFRAGAASIVVGKLLAPRSQR